MPQSEEEFVKEKKRVRKLYTDETHAFRKFFGNKVREYRTQVFKLKGSEFCQKFNEASDLKLTPNKLSRIERGEIEPSLYLAYKLCQFFGVNYNTLSVDPLNSDDPIREYNKKLFQETFGPINDIQQFISENFFSDKQENPNDAAK